MENKAQSPLTTDAVSMIAAPSFWAPRTITMFETPDGTASAAPAGPSVEVPGTTPVAETSTPAVTTPDPADELGAGFKLDDVDPAYRADVERYVKLAHGGFTRKAQEVAAQRREAESALSLTNRLADPETRQAALQELADQYDLELEFEDDDVEPVSGAPVVPTGTPDPTDPVEAARQAAREEYQRAQQETATTQAQADYVKNVQSALNDGLDAWAKAKGLDKASDHVRNQVIANLAQIAPLENGMPDMESALALYEEDEARIVAAYLASKDPGGQPITNGTSQTTDHVDLSVRENRLKKAQEIAGRHL